MSTTLDRSVAQSPINKAGEKRYFGRSVDFWFCATLTFIVLLVQAWNIVGYPLVFDDEGTYLAQAWAIDHGIGLTPYTYTFDHPPLGWIQIAALAWIPSMLFHGPAQLVVAYARIVMLPFTVATTIFVYVLARRMSLPRWSAAIAVLAFGLSPLSVTLEREIFLDNIAVAWMLGAFVLAYSPRKHLWHHVAAGLCAGVAILSKETVLLAFPALVVALWQNVHPVTRKYSFVGFIGAFVLMGVQYPLYAALKGEIYASGGRISLWTTGIKYQLARPGSGSVFTHGSNSYSILHNWLFYDPVLIEVGAAAALLTLFSRRLRPVGIASVVMMLTALRPGGYLPAMYVIDVLPFFALAIAGVADQVIAFILTFRARQVFWQQVTRLVVVAVCAAAAFLYIAPKWYSGDATATTQNLNKGYAEATDWIATHVKHPGNTRIVVDDTLWLNMVQDGFKPGRYDIYFFKLDADPVLMDSLPGPNGQKWKSIQWVISTPYLWENANKTLIPTAYKLLNHSKVVWSYGKGGISNEIQIRKVIP